MQGRDPAVVERPVWFLIPVNNTFELLTPFLDIQSIDQPYLHQCLDGHLAPDHWVRGTILRVTG